MRSKIKPKKCMKFLNMKRSAFNFVFVSSLILKKTMRFPEFKIDSIKNHL